MNTKNFQLWRDADSGIDYSIFVTCFTLIRRPPHNFPMRGQARKDLQSDMRSRRLVLLAVSASCDSTQPLRKPGGDLRREPLAACSDQANKNLSRDLLLESVSLS